MFSNFKVNYYKKYMYMFHIITHISNWIRTHFQMGVHLILIQCLYGQLIHCNGTHLFTWLCFEGALPASGRSMNQLLDLWSLNLCGQLLLLNNIVTHEQNVSHMVMNAAFFCTSSKTNPSACHFLGRKVCFKNGR